MSLTQPDTDYGTTQRARRLFFLEYAVAEIIDAPAEHIWNLLTNAREYSNWNSTVIEVKGQIQSGAAFQLVSTLAPKRPFDLKVVGWNPPHKMVWASGNPTFFWGERTYTLEPTETGVVFTMREIFRGVMMPMMAAVLPDFRENFAQFAADLKRAAEST